jgi:sulfatase maturation enzyme AslB (radical SAM superfamily)
MDIELAKSILLKELEFVRKSDKYEELEIDFMGGEPFVNFQLIREIVDWLLNLKQDIPFITSCSTNGTLVNETNKKWLLNHKKIFVPGLSYDGNLDMQKQNRGTQNQSIDVQFFIDTWPLESVHMTISRETLPHLAKGVLALQNGGGKIDAALAQGVEWTKDDATMYYEQLTILSEAYLSDKKLKPINLLNRPLFSIASRKPTQDKFCGTGTSMITYDIDGKTYPCHLFSPIVLGSEGALEIENAGITEDCPITDHFCDECILSNWCPTCYGFNYYLRADISSRDHRWCNMIHTQALASYEFQISYYHKHIDTLTENDMAQLKGAIETYHLFTEKDILT